MPYPISPFNKDFDIDILFKSNCDTFHKKIQNSFLEETLKWICTSPNITSIRVNTLKISVNELHELIYKNLSQLAKEKNRQLPNINIHPILNEVIVIDNWKESNLNLKSNIKEIIVDVHCGASVLRGAHIFAPGVLGMLTGINVGDEVSVYVDVGKKCKKGMQKIYDCSNKVFIGNGITLLDRSHLFAEHCITKGIAIKITDTIIGSIQTEDLVPNGLAMLHNIPSVVCVHVLNPQPNDTILDMCASPGNKTTNIAAFSKNTSYIIAIDKTPNKVKVLKENCENFGANVNVFQADSTKILDSCQTQNINNGPPYSIEVFDKVLLDAPCSALGKRPQFVISASAKELTSYVPLQRKLFENAVGLLKVNGSLVYSTCTITLSENEGIVAWALKRFKNIRLQKAEPYLGQGGLSGTELTEIERSCVQRFGPFNNVDSVGFFIAKFIKISS